MGRGRRNIFILNNTCKVITYNICISLKVDIKSDCVAPQTNYGLYGTIFVPKTCPKCYLC